MTEYHQGLKIENLYKCQNTEEVCSKIIEVQPSFVEIIKILILPLMVKYIFAGSL